MPSNLAHSSYTSQEAPLRSFKGNTSETDKRKLGRTLAKLNNQKLVILKLVGVNSDIAVREIQDKISLSESAVSSNLRELYKLGLLGRTRAEIGGGQLGPPPFLYSLSNKVQLEDIELVINDRKRDGDSVLLHLEQQIFDTSRFNETGKDLKDEPNQLLDVNKQLQLTDVVNQEDLPFSLNSDEQPVAEGPSEEEPIELQPDTANTTEPAPHLLEDNDTGLTRQLMRESSSNATIKEILKVFDKGLNFVFSEEGVVVNIEKRLDARLNQQNIKISVSISNDTEHSKFRKT